MVARALEAARQEAGLSRDELWAHYWRRGGRAKRSALISYLKGQTEPQVSQYNLIAQTLNEALEEAGKKTRLPVLVFGSGPVAEAPPIAVTADGA